MIYLLQIVFNNSLQKNNAVEQAKKAQSALTNALSPSSFITPQRQQYNKNIQNKTYI